MASEELIKNKYRIIEELGAGGFGVVYLAEDIELKEQFALKRFSPKKFAEKIENEKLASKYSLLSEIRRAIKLNHPNILRYYSAFKTSEKSKWGMTDYEVGIMEYVKDGDLGDYLKTNKSIDEIVEVFRSILEGIVYLHKKRIIHRDLKPSNILMDGKTPKIMDFGISKNLENEEISISLLLGTVEYMAPEQFFPKTFGGDGATGYEIDVWAFGVMFYWAIAGKLFFGERKTGDTQDEIRERITSETFLANMDVIPASLQPIITDCLKRKAINRPTSAELLKRFKNIGQQPIQESTKIRPLADKPEQISRDNTKTVIQEMKPATPEVVENVVEKVTINEAVADPHTVNSIYRKPWYIGGLSFVFLLLCGGIYSWSQDDPKNDLLAAQSEHVWKEFRSRIDTSQTITEKLASYEWLEETVKRILQFLKPDFQTLYLIEEIRNQKFSV